MRRAGWKLPVILQVNLLALYLHFFASAGWRMERVKGIEPSSLRIPLPSSANPCVYKLKLAIPGFINYIHLHSNDA